MVNTDLIPSSFKTTFITAVSAKIDDHQGFFRLCRGLGTFIHRDQASTITSSDGEVLVNASTLISGVSPSLPLAASKYL